MRLNHRVQRIADPEGLTEILHQLGTSGAHAAVVGVDGTETAERNNRRKYCDRVISSRATSSSIFASNSAGRVTETMQLARIGFLCSLSFGFITASKKTQNQPGVN
jgi:hypothetical protein